MQGKARTLAMSTPGSANSGSIDFFSPSMRKHADEIAANVGNYGDGRIEQGVIHDVNFLFEEGAF